jgi:hypothetical protein
MVKRLLIVLAAVAVFAAGCANSSTSSSPSGAAPGSSSAPMPSTSDAPSTGASGAPAPGASGTSTKLTGTLEQGVEPSCLVLRGTGRDHTLYFADPQVKKQAKIGDTVTVVGQARPTQITTCQQGIPFLVEAMAVD